jgi:transcriptional regulator with XRE-family HTH domain
MDNINNKDIGLRISELRKSRSITQQELAYKLQITIACLSRYENNKRTPRMDLIEKMAKIFNVDLNYFLDYSNSNCNKQTNEVEVNSKEKMIFDITMLLNKASTDIIADVKKYAELLLFKDKMEKEEV